MMRNSKRRGLGNKTIEWVNLALVTLASQVNLVSLPLSCCQDFLSPCDEFMSFDAEPSGRAW
jgi:hypothetical protein